MCGIAGWLSWREPPSIEVVEAMTARLIHRGPDAGGVRAFGPAVLGHRRLAVVDLSERAAQPMTSADGAVSLAYNGEIYNFRELRAELQAAGHAFRSDSDTEVVIEGYRRWGLDVIGRLNGMFAFALWDGAARRLILARDRMGEKPLFYAEAAGGIVFASELRALTVHPGVERRVEPAAVAMILAAGYCAGGLSPIQGTKRLPAAYYLVAEEGSAASLVRYWDPLPAFVAKSRHRSEAEAAEELDALIADAVARRMVADVPLGAFLSGGTDSAVIVGAMGRLGPAEAVRAFSIGFDQSEFCELDDARAAARHFGVAHREEVMRGNLADDLPAIVASMDEPLADTSIIPTWRLARFARRHVTVALSGDGADEIFAGYPTYVADRLRRATAWIPGPFTAALADLVRRLVPDSPGKVPLDFKIKRFLDGHRLSADRAHVHWRILLDDGMRRSLGRPGRLPELDAYSPFAPFAAEAAALDPLDRALYVDMKTWMADDILVKVDRCSMAHSLEVRAPFLDHRLVEFAASLPARWKLRGLRGKHLLKRSQQGRLPPAAMGRKRGFNAPVSYWFRGELRDLGRAATSSPILAEWVRPDGVEHLWSEHQSGRRDHGLGLFALTCLGLWLESLSAA